MWAIQPSKIAHHIEFFLREDGRFIGYVIQFNKNEPVHAWSEHVRLGQGEGVGAAKDLVEEIIDTVEAI